MHTASVPHSPGSDPVEQHLQQVLGSRAFRHAARLQRLLSYLVRETLAGRESRLKGYSIALDVFDRPADFDPGSNALVRVEMGRLRSKLLEYYAGDGQADPLRFDFPKGCYAVRLQPRPDAPTPSPQPTAARAEPPSLAVMPFFNLSDDAGQIWFSDGLTEDLITDLSKLSGLRVCSRHACFALRNMGIDDPQVAASKLGVRYLLQGSVRRDARKVRINAHLIDTQSGSQVWADRFDRPVTDVLDVQADVTEAIVRQLAVELSPLEEVRLGHSGTSSAAAHEELLRGLGYYWRFLPTFNREAQMHFERAALIDPEYADAHVWMARSTVYAYTMRWGEGNRCNLEDASRSIERALELDRLLPQAHALSSWVHLWSDRHEAALVAGARGVELDPNSADARLFHSIALTMATRTAAGLPEAEMCLRLNPMPSAFYLWVYGMALMYAQRWDEAADAMEKGIQVGPTFQPNHVFLMHTLVQARRWADAGRCAQRYELIYGTREVPLRTPGCSAPLRQEWEVSLRQLGLEPQP